MSDPLVLSSLGEDVLSRVCEFLRPDDTLAAALSCRAVCSALPSSVPRRSGYAAALVSARRMQWALEECALKPSMQLAERASARGQLDVLQVLHRHAPLIFCNFSADKAALHGHLATLKWLVEIGVDYKNADYYAAKGGHIEVLRWLHERMHLRACACTSAARGGHFETLRWLRENGVYWNSKDVCEVAANGGYLDMLRWARENGAKWDDRVCWVALREGHVETLRWLRSQKAPWNRIKCEALVNYVLTRLREVRERGETDWHLAPREQAFLEVQRWVSESESD